MGDMSEISQSVTELIDQLGRLPGIGRKTAERLAYHLLRVHETGGVCTFGRHSSRARKRPLLFGLLQLGRGRTVWNLHGLATGHVAAVHRRATSRFDRSRAVRGVSRPLSRLAGTDCSFRRSRTGSA